MAKEKTEKSAEKPVEKHEKKHAVKEEAQKESVAIAEIAEEVIEEEKKVVEQQEPQLVEDAPVKRPKKKKAKEKPVWIEYKPKEIEELVVNLSNQGHSCSEIGAILRDQHGVLDAKQATKKNHSADSE